MSVVNPVCPYNLLNSSPGCRTEFFSSSPPDAESGDPRPVPQVRCLGLLFLLLWDTNSVFVPWDPEHQTIFKGAARFYFTDSEHSAADRTAPKQPTNVSTAARSVKRSFY